MANLHHGPWLRENLTSRALPVAIIHGMKRDLFDEVSVTWDEVRAWVRAVPRLDPDSAYAEYYVKAWNVTEKIRRAKINGTFDEIIGQKKV